MKLRIAASALLMLALSGAVWAGTVYVPLAADFERSGIRFQTQLFVSNDDTERHGFVPYFIDTNTNGTLRGAEAAGVFIDPGKTQFFSNVGISTGDIGMLELDAEPYLAVSARFASSNGAGGHLIGAEIPVVSDANLVPAGEVSHLEGWMRSSTRQTDFGLINLEDRALVCSFTLIRADGSVLWGPWTNLPVPPRGHRYFEDALGKILQNGLNTVRAEVSCDGRNYPFAVILDLANGESAFIAPATSDSTLSPPGATPTPTTAAPNPTPTPGPAPTNVPPNSGPPPVPGSVYTFTQSGLFHEPTAANPVRRFSFPFQKGLTYRVIEVKMDVHFGGYYKAYQEGIHNFFWLARNEYRENTFGYVNVRGPGRNLFYNMTNVDLPNKGLSRGQTNTQLIAGHQYHLDWTYDTRSGKITAVLTDLTAGGSVTAVHNTTVNKIVTQGNGFIMDVGLQLMHQDVPSFGWRYTNLLLRFSP